jgi:drug/metabolite transporter (DMT)-like permease
MRSGAIVAIVLSALMWATGFMIVKFFPPANLIQFNVDPKYPFAYFMFYTGMYGLVATAILLLVSLKFEQASKISLFALLIIAVGVFYGTYC